jgi:mannosylglycerate hydrolase
MALEAHIVTHTHWDREWYHPLERFRQRLVALVDELLDDPPSSRESFLLDGQAIILEDYLGVRPDRADALAALLREGKLEAGPWYVLADELIPSGEAIVRNLFAGRRMLRRLGAESPPVLYSPDSFGHPAALPSIAHGFGLPLIILWRGYGGARWPAGDTVRWRSPSGDDALLFHLPRDGYEFGSHLPLDEDAARARWLRMRGELVPRSTAGVMLIQNGADHHARQPRLRDALTMLERAGADDGVRRSSLTQFAERLVERSALQSLPLVRGELRDSYGYTWTLQGTFGTRAHEKRLNARAERMLLRDAEPWAALAARGGLSRRPLVEQAWKTLLTAHPHDTLCGCSTDEVADAMELRLRSAINQGVGIRDDAIAELIGHDPVAAREAKSEWQPIVIVRNAAPRKRAGVAILEIEEFLADIAVGPGSAPLTPAAPAVSMPKPRVPALGALQVLSRSVRHSRTESPRHYPDDDLVVVTRAAAWIPDAAPYGITSYAIGAGDVRRRFPDHPVTTNRHSLRNEILDVTVGESGEISLGHVESGRRIASLIDFIDEGDAGDLYTPALRRRETRVEFRTVRPVHRGALYGELALRYRIIDGNGRDRRHGADVTVHLALEAGAPFLRIRVSSENRGENHRLRLVLRSDVVNPEVWADAAFGVVRREPIDVGDAEAALEAPPPTAPLHRYVSLFREGVGVTVFSDGLAEYEATAEGGVLVTLVRAVGELSRNDLPERPGHAGWPTPTPGAQCIGPFDAAFAVMPHGARLPATIDAIERAADDVLSPLVGTTLRSALRVPSTVEGPELVGSGLAFSAMKESEDGEWLVLRCVNLRDDEVAGRWRLPFAVREARTARLDETIISDMVTIGSEVEFLAASRAIVTILVR